MVLRNLLQRFKAKKLIYQWIKRACRGEEPNSGAEIIKNMFSDICEKMDFVQPME